MTEVIQKMLSHSPFFAKPFYKELEELAMLKHKTHTITDNMRNRINEVFVSEMNKVQDKNETFIEPFDKENPTKILGLVKTCDFLVREKQAIFTFNGIFEREKSPIAQILENKLIERGIYKKKMLKNKADGDEKNARLNDSIQKFKKEVANSLFGVLGLKSFFLFNTITAGSITGNSATQLQLLINQIEKMFGGRVILRNYSEVVAYLTENTEYRDINLEDSFNYFNKLNYEEFYKFDDTTLFNLISSYCQFDIEDDLSPVQVDFIKTLCFNIVNDDKNRLRFYFLNNISRFLSSSSKLEDSIVTLKDNLCSLNDFNEKEMDNYFDEHLADYFKMYLFDWSIQGEQDNLARNYTRTCVMVSDTDSLFVSSPALTNLVKDTISSVVTIEDPQDLDVFTFRILTYVGTLTTGFQLSDTTHNCYMIGDNHKYKYKSEYFYPKMLLLKVKKTYLGLCTVQEGYKIPPFVDEKNIKKTSYTSSSTDFVMDLCSLFIDRNKEFDYKETFDLIDRHKDKIRTKILDDLDSSIGKPLTYKTANNYDDPFRVANFLAGEFYNILHPYNKLPSSSKCNSLDLLMPVGLTGGTKINLDFNIKTILEFYSEKLPAEMFEHLNIIMTTESYPSMRDKILNLGGIPYIGVPKGEQIPSYLLPLIDVDSLVMKNIDVRSENFLEAVGIYVNVNSKGSNITNIIKF